MRDALTGRRRALGSSLTLAVRCWCVWRASSSSVRLARWCAFLITGAQRIFISGGIAGEFAWRLFGISWLGGLDFWSNQRRARCRLQAQTAPRTQRTLREIFRLIFSVSSGVLLSSVVHRVVSVERGSSRECNIREGEIRRLRRARDDCVTAWSMIHSVSNIRFFPSAHQKPTRYRLNLGK